MTLPIDRTAKAALDANLVNGNTSDAPVIKASNDVVYNTIDELNNKVDATQAPGTVTTNKLADGSVTTQKLANGSVTASKLDPALMAVDTTLQQHRLTSTLDHPDGSVTLAKMDASLQAGITASTIYAYKNMGGF